MRRQACHAGSIDVVIYSHQLLHEDMRQQISQIVLQLLHCPGQEVHMHKKARQQGFPASRIHTAMEPVLAAAPANQQSYISVHTVKHYSQSVRGHPGPQGGSPPWWGDRSLPAVTRGPQDAGQLTFNATRFAELRCLLAQGNATLS